MKSDAAREIDKALPLYVFSEHFAWLITPAVATFDTLEIHASKFDVADSGEQFASPGTMMGLVQSAVAGPGVRPYSRASSVCFCSEDSMERRTHLSATDETQR